MRRLLLQQAFSGRGMLPASSQNAQGFVEYEFDWKPDWTYATQKLQAASDGGMPRNHVQ